jgi:hypothetical protein
MKLDSFDDYTDFLDFKDFSSPYPEHFGNTFPQAGLGRINRRGGSGKPLAGFLRRRTEGRHLQQIPRARIARAAPLLAPAGTHLLPSIGFLETLAFCGKPPAQKTSTSARCKVDPREFLDSELCSASGGHGDGSPD